jgi:hypothetical protein
VHRKIATHVGGFSVHPLDRFAPKCDGRKTLHLEEFPEVRVAFLDPRVDAPGLNRRLHRRAFRPVRVDFDRPGKLRETSGRRAEQVPQFESDRGS